MTNLVLKEHLVRERECIHRNRNAHGNLYSGQEYIQALQRLRNDKALSVARNVGSLFWSDAPHLKVWLCQSCSHDIGL